MQHKPEMSCDSEIEWLIVQLWEKSSAFKFKIPDTVIMKNGEISNWYFTAARGYILKKNRINLNGMNIHRRFLKNLNTNFEHVGGTAFHYDQLERRNALTLEHIPIHDFPSFCQMIEKSNRRFKIPKIVQKFVYSKSSKNQMIKC